MQRKSRITLTDREREVLSLVARGLSNKRIAAELGIKERTVKGYLTHIYGKLGVKKRTEAVSKAAQLGFLDLTERSSKHR